MRTSKFGSDGEAYVTGTKSLILVPVCYSATPPYLTTTQEQCEQSYKYLGRSVTPVPEGRKSGVGSIVIEVGDFGCRARARA